MKEYFNKEKRLSRTLEDKRNDTSLHVQKNDILQKKSAIALLKQSPSYTNNILQRYFQGVYSGNNRFLIQDTIKVNDGKYRYPEITSPEHDKQTPNLYVAEDTSLAISNQNQPKTFFATEKVLNKSNEQLHQVNSCVRLQKDDNFTIVFEDQFKTPTIKLYQSYPVNIRAKKEYQNSFIDICIEMAGLVSGSNTFYSNKLKTGNESKPARFSNLSSDEVNRLANDYHIRIAKVDKKNEKEQITKDLSINEFASPDVGEAFSIVSYTNDEENPPQNGWGYHFAGVVAKSLDGKDTITLENYNRKNEIRRYQVDSKTEENKLTAWFFQIYGTQKDQSFHEKQKATGAFHNPITVRVAKDDPADKDNWKRRFTQIEQCMKLFKINNGTGIISSSIYIIDNLFHERHIESLNKAHLFCSEQTYPKLSYTIQLLAEYQASYQAGREDKKKAEKIIRYIQTEMNFEGHENFKHYLVQYIYNIKYPNLVLEAKCGIINNLRKLVDDELFFKIEAYIDKI